MCLKLNMSYDIFEAKYVVRENHLKTITVTTEVIVWNRLFSQEPVTSYLLVACDRLL